MTSVLKVTEIQDPTNGNTALTIDSNGIITRPYVPTFSAYGPASWTQLSSGTNEYVICGNVQVNNGSHYNATTGLFTAPIAGYYHFTLNLYAWLQGASQGDNFNYYGAYIWKNGQALTPSGLYGYVNSGDNDRTDVITATMQLNATDTVGARIYANAGDCEWYGTHTVFAGFMIG